MVTHARLVIFSKTPFMRMLRCYLTPFVLISILAFPRPAAAVDIVVNARVAQHEFSRAMMRAIFGMRRSQWPDGSAVNVFVLHDDHPAHQAVCKEKLNLYPYQLRQLWERQQFTGIGQMPVFVANEEEMALRVAETPGAIGYLTNASANAKLRVIQLQ